MELSKGKLLNIYERMLSIRNFDLKVNQLVKRGMVPGMTHLSVGEEAANVGAIAALNADDLITSNHRGHGQVIAKGIDLNGMMAEIMGKATGSKWNCRWWTWNGSWCSLYSESEEYWKNSSLFFRRWSYK